MKPGIHPAYRPVLFHDTSANAFWLIGSTVDTDKTYVHSDGNTYPYVTLDVSSASHPFWTGKGKILDTAGRVEKFRRRYGQRKR